MDPNNGLEARISKEETRTILTMDLEDIPPTLIRIPLRDPTSHMGIIVQTMEDPMINSQINHSIETVEIDLEMNLSTTRMRTGETMEIFLALHRLT